MTDVIPVSVIKVESLVVPNACAKRKADLTANSAPVLLVRVLNVNPVIDVFTLKDAVDV
jgi:hypothetical protein